MGFIGDFENETGSQAAAGDEGAKWEVDDFFAAISVAEDFLFFVIELAEVGCELDRGAVDRGRFERIDSSDFGAVEKVGAVDFGDCKVSGG